MKNLENNVDVKRLRGKMVGHMFDTLLTNSIMH